MTLVDFVDRFMDESVDFIRKITRSYKVSLFGYCCGGDLVLVYGTVHHEKVKNLITIATTGVFDLNSLVSVWTRFMKGDYLLEAFGNVPRHVIKCYL